MIIKLSPVGGNVFAAVKKTFNANIDNFVIIVKNSNQLMHSLPAATKLGQGNIFTSVCLSTGVGWGGGGVSGLVHAGIFTLPPPPPREQTPPPQEQTQPGSRHPPGKQTAAYG